MKEVKEIEEIKEVKEEENQGKGFRHGRVPFPC